MASQYEISETSNLTPDNFTSNDTRMTSNLTPDDFLCEICMSRINDAVVTIPCGHSLCRICIDKYISTNDNNKKMCPFCKTNLSNDTPYSINYYLRSIISKLEPEDKDINKISDNFTSEMKEVIEETVKNEKCAICWNELSKNCLVCESERRDTVCIQVYGSCGHVYHNHCIKRWLRTRNVCPLDDEAWIVDPIKNCDFVLHRTVNVQLIKSNYEVIISGLHPMMKVNEIITKLNSIGIPTKKINLRDSKFRSDDIHLVTLLELYEIDNRKADWILQLKEVE